MGSATKQTMGSTDRFTELRAAVQEAAGIAEVTPVKIERVSPRSILVLLSLGLAAYVLIPMFAEAGNLADQVRTASPV